MTHKPEFPLESYIVALSLLETLKRAFSICEPSCRYRSSKMRTSFLSKFGMKNHTPHSLVGMQIVVHCIKKMFPFVSVRSKSSGLHLGDRFIPVEILPGLSVYNRDKLFNYRLRWFPDSSS